MTLKPHLVSLWDGLRLHIQDIETVKKAVTHLSPSLVIVQVHESPTGGLAFTPLPHIHKGLRKGHSISNVITAA